MYLDPTICNTPVMQSSLRSFDQIYFQLTSTVTILYFKFYTQDDCDIDRNVSIFISSPQWNLDNDEPPNLLSNDFDYSK